MKRTATLAFSKHARGATSGEGGEREAGVRRHQGYAVSRRELAGGAGIPRGEKGSSDVQGGDGSSVC